MVKIETIKPGYYVAVSLVPGAAPENCYVGEVKAVDDLGIRINLQNWDDELDSIRVQTEDIFIPWDNVSAMLVSTHEEPTRRFLRDRAPVWVNRLNEPEE